MGTINFEIIGKGNTKMKVKNLNGTSENNPKPVCNCKNWLEHWEKNKYPKGDKQAGWCRACRKKIEHSKLNGAHVIKVGSDDQNRYIVPLCDSCHGKANAEYEVNAVDLVSANCSLCKNKK